MQIKILVLTVFVPKMMYNNKNITDFGPLYWNVSIIKTTNVQLSQFTILLSVRDKRV